MCSLYYQFFLVGVWYSTSIRGLRRIKISLLIRSPRSAPPLFRYFPTLHHKILSTKLFVNTILVIATWRSPSRLVLKGNKSKKLPNLPVGTRKTAYLFIGEFAIFRRLTHLVPYLKIQRILVNELTSMTPKSKNTCRKLRVSAFNSYVIFYGTKNYLDMMICDSLEFLL